MTDQTMIEAIAEAAHWCPGRMLVGFVNAEGVAVPLREAPRDMLAAETTRLREHRLSSPTWRPRYD